MSSSNTEKGVDYMGWVDLREQVIYGEQVKYGEQGEYKKMQNSGFT